MRFVVLFLVMIPFGASAAATSDIFIKTVIKGCLPNAMGLFPMDRQHLDTTGVAGFIPAEKIDSEWIKKLALQKEVMAFTPKEAPKNIVLVPSPKARICRVALLDQSSQGMRKALVEELMEPGAPWVMETNGKQDDIVMQSFRWTIEGKPDIVMTISGPKESDDDEDMQLLVSVSQSQKK